MKKAIFYSFLLLCFVFLLHNASFASDRNNISKNLPDTAYIHVDSLESCKIDSFLNEMKVDSMIKFASTLIGIPYKYAGTTTSGFDCSGFTSFVFAHFGISLSHSSADQINFGIPVEKEDLKPGDLVLFKSRNVNSDRIRHVGIVTAQSKDGLNFIHASVSKGITIYPIDHPYYIHRYVAARRLIY